MDIRIVRVYYTLKLLDGLYYIFVRDEIIGPTRDFVNLGITFETETDAKACVEKLNKAQQ